MSKTSAVTRSEPVLEVAHAQLCIVTENKSRKQLYTEAKGARYGPQCLSIAAFVSQSGSPFRPGVTDWPSRWPPADSEVFVAKR
jgi:hypothetical protein